ncbi:antirepressor [Geobacillus stearothermophilus]|nr:antirepressor [Geobacillus stearothermophilus]
MTEIRAFNHEMFGELQVLVENGEIYFPATDVAIILGYTNPHKAIKDHCKEKGGNDSFSPYSRW